MNGKHLAADYRIVMKIAAGKAPQVPCLGIDGLAAVIAVVPLHARHQSNFDN